MPSLRPRPQPAAASTPTATSSSWCSRTGHARQNRFGQRRRPLSQQLIIARSMLGAPRSAALCTQTRFAILDAEAAMAQTIPLGLQTQRAEQTESLSRAASVPWFVWSGVVAVTSIAFGLYWDISWHMTIGRDTFWTPAHLAIQFGGILAAITCMVLIFSTTFSRDPAAKATSVRVWGFRGPLGAFLTAWGGVTMVTSAPFDNWWHASFGLDVEILSPPHVVLGLGIMGVGVGYLVLIVAEKNRAVGAARKKLSW